MDGKLHYVTNNKDFKSILELHKEKGFTLVVCFSAKWCGPCKNFVPVLQALATQHPSIIFIKVDIDACEDIANEYNISSIPTTIIMRVGQTFEILSGINPIELKNKIV